MHRELVLDMQGSIYTGQEVYVCMSKEQQSSGCAHVSRGPIQPGEQEAPALTFILTPFLPFTS